MLQLRFSSPVHQRPSRTAAVFASRAVEPLEVGEVVARCDGGLNGVGALDELARPAVARLVGNAVLVVVDAVGRVAGRLQERVAGRPDGAELARRADAVGVVGEGEVEARVVGALVVARVVGPADPPVEVLREHHVVVVLLALVGDLVDPEDHVLGERVIPLQPAHGDLQPQPTSPLLAGARVEAVRRLGPLRVERVVHDEVGLDVGVLHPAPKEPVPLAGPVDGAVGPRRRPRRRVVGAGGGWPGGGSSSPGPGASPTGPASPGRGRCPRGSSWTSGRSRCRRRRGRRPRPRTRCRRCSCVPSPWATRPTAGPGSGRSRRGWRRACARGCRRARPTGSAWGRRG